MTGRDDTVNASHPEVKLFRQRGFKTTLFGLWVFTEVVRSKSLVLVGNLAHNILPMYPVCTKWRARGQVVCLLLIKPFDQSPFSPAHVALWAPAVCSVRQKALL